MIEKVQGGFTDFDAEVASPYNMGTVGRLGNELGPNSPMPTPKTDNVTRNVAKEVDAIKGGKIDVRADQRTILQFNIGNAAFSDQHLAETYTAAVQEVL